jgi:hypothetical protein
MMPETSGARIFISYSRKDGAEFAASLRKRLQKSEKNFNPRPSGQVFPELLARRCPRSRAAGRVLTASVTHCKQLMAEIASAIAS